MEHAGQGDEATGCFACGGTRTRLIDLGTQPVCNRYVNASRSEGYRAPLILSRCDRCALLQLGESWPAGELRPRFDWIRYREPEQHLDSLSSILGALPGLPNDPLIAGLTYKDEPVLYRLARLGMPNVWSISMSEDLQIGEPGAGIETVQERLDVTLAQRLAAKRGRPDVIVVRHLLEHAAYLRSTVAALKAWAKPGGYVIFEVPDSERAFTGCDYSTMWEEHVLYFTEATLKVAMAAVDLEVAASHRYPYAVENCLVVIARNAPAPRGAVPLDGASLRKELQLGETYRDALPSTSARWKRHLQTATADGSKVALFGAGHRAVTFINLLQLGSSLDCVIDDDQNKTGLRMPGSELPIVGSECLRDDAIALCLLALSPESEDGILRRHRAFVDRGGRIESIYPHSAHASAAARGVAP